MPSPSPLRAIDDPPRQPSALGSDDGTALVLVLIVSLLVLATGMGLVVVGDTERTIASNDRGATTAFYAADAGLERALADLSATDRWSDVLAGTRRSSFVDASLTPVTAWGRRLDLQAMTTARQAASDASQPWGANNPRWRLFAYGPIAALLPPDAVHGLEYVVVWAADDPSETDGNPSVDANGVLMLVAEAFGPYGADRAVEATVQRADLAAAGDRSDAERGGDVLNQRAPAPAVSTPGQAIAAMTLSLQNGGMTP